MVDVPANNPYQMLALHPGTPSCGNPCAECEHNTRVDVPVLTDDDRELGVVHFCPNHDA